VILLKSQQHTGNLKLPTRSFNQFTPGRLPRHRWRQPLAPPARHHHAHSQPHAKERIETADDLLMSGRGLGEHGQGEKNPCFWDRPFRPGILGDLHSDELTSPSESFRWTKVRGAQNITNSRKTDTVSRNFSILSTEDYSTI